MTYCGPLGDDRSKAAHSGNAPYTNARRHSGVHLAGIQEKKMDPRLAHSGMTKKSEKED
ncbi:hypothetical protein ASZ90_008483 [hydrocarbon metagenome]|uniref:Uncharacterized protein n=1 Tax=hydrocarbon metagenome TaxID=938273 RepID=A0A0W8FN40_9ZZZZ